MHPVVDPTAGGRTTAERSAQVVVVTDRFDDDLALLTSALGFRIDAIFPADAPDTAIVSANGVRLRLQAGARPAPITLRLLSDDQTGEIVLPGGSRVECKPLTTTYQLPDNRPSVVVTHDDGANAPGRAGMRYRDLLPDRWGGRFVASHITIPEGGPVPDYVHFHKVRFQMIFVKSGWVRLVYEDQGDPFVMHAGDCVLQPPEIRHRVLEAGPGGLEVIEIGCPALHETIADWSLPLPNRSGDPHRTWAGQRFVRHTAAGAPSGPWRHAGWECRETGIGAATDGLAGVRVARPFTTADSSATAGGEFTMLCCLSGSVSLAIDAAQHRLAPGSSAALPDGTAYTLGDPSPDCTLLDVTLPA